MTLSLSLKSARAALAETSISRTAAAANDEVGQIDQKRAIAVDGGVAQYVAQVRDNVPRELHERPVWLLWRETRTQGDRKPKKIPEYANGRKRGPTDTEEDRSQLVTLDEAAVALAQSGATGLGIALGKVPGYAMHISGIDLDNCYVGETLDPRADNLITSANSYAERSPSGTGLHILGLGSVESRADHAAGLEIYSGSRFFTVTGDAIKNKPLRDLTSTVRLAQQLYHGNSDLSERKAAVGPSEMVTEGKRHSALVAMAKRLNSAGIGGHDAQAMLLTWNANHCFPPLPEEEVRQVAAWQLDHQTEDPLHHVRVSIERDLSAGPSAIKRALSPKFVIKDRIPVAGANLCGVGGMGKTTLTLNEYIRIVCGLRIYDAEVVKPGTCVLVTAEDGTEYPRYILRRALEDGVEFARTISEKDADRAMEFIKIIHWSRAEFGGIVTVGEYGNLARAPAFDILVEQLQPLNPSMVTLDPAALFGPGERFVNDGDAFLAAVLHETALDLGCCFQLLDHVSQNVARGGVVDQYAARGGTAKTDNARLARQLVRYKPKKDLPLPVSVTPDDVERGRVFELHWTKSNYGPLPPSALLLRRGYWIEPLRAQSADEIDLQRRTHAERIANDDVQSVIDTVREAISSGEKPSQSKIERMDITGPHGKLTRQRIRQAIVHGETTGRLRLADLPKEERHGARKNYLVPVDA